MGPSVGSEQDLSFLGPKSVLVLTLGSRPSRHVLGPSKPKELYLKPKTRPLKAVTPHSAIRLYF